jgi:hypothetical protein
MILITGVLISTNYVFYKEIEFFMKGRYENNSFLADFVTLITSGLSNIFIFSCIYFTWGVVGEVKMPDGGNSIGLITKDYILSLYFSVVTWTTLGYGDFKPPSDLRLIASLQALMGYLYMAIVVGIFLNLPKANKQSNK